MITPLSNTLLFDNQPGLVSPSVTVNKQVTGRYLLPIVNNTGKTVNVNTKTVIAFIEHLHRTDLVELVYITVHILVLLMLKIDDIFHTDTVRIKNIILEMNLT